MHVISNIIGMHTNRVLISLLSSTVNICNTDSVMHYIIIINVLMTCRSSRLLVIVCCSYILIGHWQSTYIHMYVGLRHNCINKETVAFGFRIKIIIGLGIHSMNFTKMFQDKGINLSYFTCDF